MIRGSCLCQGVRFEIRGPFAGAAHSKAPWFNIGDDLPQHAQGTQPG